MSFNDYLNKINGRFFFTSQIEMRCKYLSNDYLFILNDNIKQPKMSVIDTED